MSVFDGTNRLYEPIWNKLKALPAKLAATQGIAITAPRPLHRRIVKAVIKEKWLDLGYKMEIEPMHAKLSYSRSGSIVTFYLTKYDNDSIAHPFDVGDF